MPYPSQPQMETLQISCSPLTLQKEVKPQKVYCPREWLFTECLPPAYKMLSEREKYGKKYLPKQKEQSWL